MTNQTRLKSAIINTKNPIKFYFNNKAQTGFEGDTIASALLANNVKITGRSFKYHRPRSIVTCDVAEPNAIFQVEKGEHTIPNVLATQAEIYENMQIFSVNCFPSPKYDFRSLTQLFSRILPAGFYYKTFLLPAIWKLVEPLIRKSAGFGSSPTKADPSKYDSIYEHCDYLIVGSGPAGLKAALELAPTNKRIILVDENHQFGGSLLHSSAIIDNVSAPIWAEQTIKTLGSYKNVVLLERATAFGYYDHNLVYVNRRLQNHIEVSKRNKVRERIYKIRAKKVILATGALERPALFENNDKPGVMLANSVLKYLKLYGVNPGSNYTFYTNNNSAYNTVFALAEENIKISAIIDSRNNVPKSIKDKLESLSITLYERCVVTKATGGKQLESVIIQELDDKKEKLIGTAKEIPANLLAVSGGFSPIIHLSSQSGAKATYDDNKNCFLPGKPVQEEISIGGCAGFYGVKNSITHTIEVLKEEADIKDTKISEEISNIDQDNFVLAYNKKSLQRIKNQFVDFQNDVTASDIALAAIEGYESIEHVKRYTALGFGTDQGKLGNVLGMNILAKVLNKKPAEVGTTTFRPSYTPTTFGAIAGQNIDSLFAPIRKTALHYWQEAQGATFEDVGEWKRAWYYPKDEETMQESLNRETLATHDSTGIMDASTLGKIDIQGPDAAKFLNLIYTNPWLKLGIGRCRYGIMLGEDGMVMDDGVTMRLSENHFVMTTTTGGAAKILTWLEYWLQIECPEMKVYLTSVTDHFSAMAISGPNSRKLVQKLFPDTNLSNETVPFMSFVDATLDTIPVRIIRISFTGELSYELHLDSNYAKHVLDKVDEVGKEFNLTPYGTETMHILRAEKGFIIVGQDTDGTVTPIDLGMDWAIGKKKIDFLGKRSLTRSGIVAKGRKQFVGLLTSDPQKIIPEGAQLVNDTTKTIPAKMQGHVTSSYFSAINDQSIALALVKNGFEREGQLIYAALQDGSFVEAKITKPVFYDPKGERQNV